MKAIFFLVIGLFLPVAVQAQVQISEVLADPDTSGDKSEWIELYNSGDESIDLALWELDEIIFTVESYSLEPAEYLVITKSRLDFDAEFGQVQNIIELPTLSLKNSGDVVTLRPPGGELIQLEYPTPGRLESYQLKVGDCTEYAFGNNASPGKENALDCGPDLDPDLHNLLLTEVLPNPEGSDTDQEWIEVYNPTERNVVLFGLQIFDAEGLIAEFDEWDTITPGQYLQVFLQGSPLRNCTEAQCSEQVKLIVADETINSMQYSKIGSGESAALLNGEWQTDLVPSPGAKNVKKVEQQQQPSEQEDQSKTSNSSETESNNQVDASQESQTLQYQYRLPELVNWSRSGTLKSSIFVPVIPIFAGALIVGCGAFAWYEGWVKAVKVHLARLLGRV